MPRYLPILFICGLISVVYLPQVFSEGMFLDGVIYGAISKDFAANLEFWHFNYAFTGETDSFYEHPPFLFWIQGFWFLIVGDHFFTERLFGMLILFGLLVTMNRILKKTAPEIKWLYPLILFVITPLSYWGLMQNLMESLLSLLCLISILLLMPSRDGMNRGWVWKSALAGVLVVAAFLTKGVVGLFPLAFPFIFWLVFGANFKRMIAQTAVLAIVSGLGFLALWWNESSHYYLAQYFDQQLFSALSGERATVDSRWAIFERILMEELWVFFPLILVAIIKWSWIKKIPKQFKKWSLLLFLVALSASLPIALSPKQSGIYLIPSVPYYFMSAFVLYGGLLGATLDKGWFQKTLGAIGAVCLIAGIVLGTMNYGQFIRDKELIQKVDAIAEQVGQGSELPSLEVPEPLANAYLKRRHSISIVYDRGCTTYPRLSKARRDLVLETE